MSRSRLLPALLLACLTTAIVPGSASAAGATGQAVGVILNSGPGGEGEAFQLFQQAGATAFEAPQPWSTLEPAKSKYHLGDVSAIVRGFASAPDTQIMLIPAAIETTERSVPADLQRAPWDSHRMEARYRALLQRLKRHLSPQVRYVSIANEADVYLSAHPRQLPAFLRFARKEISTVRRLAPKAKVGVTVTFNGLTSARPGIAKKLSRLGNATFVTYYPLTGGYRMRSPRAPLHDIPRMTRLAKGRPLILQEAGYSSASDIGGSTTGQADFVRNVFAAAGSTPGAIPFISFYTLFDEPPSTCKDDSDATTFFCSLGLRRSNGKAKLAWRAFRSGIREAGAASRR